MEEKAFKLFKEAWDRIKEGYLFDESTNQTFDYMLRNLWKTQYKPIVKADIIKHFPSIFASSKLAKSPPPLFLILISLRDADIVREMQSLLLLDWIKSNASEDSTFQILNFIETFSEKQVPIDGFVNTIIKRITPAMHQDMVEALAHMLTIQHPEFMSSFLKRFLKMADQDDTLLKNYVRMTGKKGFLQLVQIATPEQMNRIFKQFKGAQRQPRNGNQLINAFNEQMKRVANFLPNKYRAEQIFNHIRSIRNSQVPNKDDVLNKDPYYVEAQRILLQLEYFEQKLPNAAQMVGVKSNAIPVIKNNLRVLMEGQNFSGYRHYTLLEAGKAPIIDLDEWQAGQQKSKKELGF